MSWKEKDFEENMRESIDKIYKNKFGKNLESITRSNRNTPENDLSMILDKKLGIDTILKFKNGSPLTLQEKTLQYANISYNALTFEYYNDPNTKDEGDWFNLVAQLYFFGYANQDKNGYAKFWIIDVAALHLNINMGNLNLNDYLRSNNYPCKANFFAIPFDKLEKLKHVVLFKSK